MRTRKIKTQADVERLIGKGYGQGQLDSYIPWIKVRDIGSHGRSREPHGTKTGRVHHLHSDLEYWYWLALEFSENVVDIREQYPLFPTHEAQAIAAKLDIAYPKFPGTNVLYVMTTDVLVTHKYPDGTTALAARTIKYQSELEDKKSIRRTLEKFELEKEIWRSMGVSDWAIVTEQTLGKTLAANLTWLRKAASPHRHLQQPILRKSFTESVVYFSNPERTLASVLRSSATTISLSYEDAVLLIKDLLWNKELLIDLRREQLSLTGKCPRFLMPSIDVYEKVA